MGVTLLTGLTGLTDPKAMATGLVAGAGIVDAGDDTFRPTASVGLNGGPYFLNLSVWGRNYGRVSERNALATLGSTIDIAGRLYVRYGLGALRDQVSIDGMNFEDKSTRDSTSSNPTANVLETEDGAGTKPEVSTAPVFLLGSGFRLVDADSWRLDFQWTSHIVPAGFGGLFLAHGRIQTILITGGMDL